jgi:hypothetical protein
LQQIYFIPFIAALKFLEVVMISFLRPNLYVQGTPMMVRLYWLAIGLFTLLFVSSVVLTFSDLEESYRVYARLGFPMWSVFFNGAGKVLGLAAILHNKSRTLKNFAFAGFLYNLLLALFAHIAQQEIDVLLAVFGLVLWVFAFVMDRKVFPVQDRVASSL